MLLGIMLALGLNWLSSTLQRHLAQVGKTCNFLNVTILSYTVVSALFVLHVLLTKVVFFPAEKRVKNLI